MTIKFHLETFDKHQGWRTLETFAHLTDADAREHEIQESFVEQGLDVKTRVTKESKKFGITETEANELFQAPFNLSGESQSSEVTAEGLARAKAEADANARKAQHVLDLETLCNVPLHLPMNDKEREALYRAQDFEMGLD